MDLYARIKSLETRVTALEGQPSLAARLKALEEAQDRVDEEEEEDEESEEDEEEEKA